MTIGIFFVVSAVACASLYGWGAVTCRLVKYPGRDLAVTVAVGLSTLVFLGGILNLSRLAYGYSLDGLLLGGVALAWLHRHDARRSLPGSRGAWTYAIVLGSAICCALGLLAKTQLAPRAFNFHDDFQKYFSQPVRMLQTGTVAGSPLSGMGFEMLGGQTFLHAVVLNHFPIPFINGVDALFALFLCLLLSVSVLPPRPAWLPVSLGAVLVVFSINPQQVNVSAHYSGAALMMTAIMLLSPLRRDGGRERAPLPPAALVGLVYAALVALKPSFALFPPFHLLLLLMASGLRHANIGRSARWCLATTLVTMLFLSPWILLHLPHYRQITSPVLGHPAAFSPAGIWNLLSPETLQWGSSHLHYSFLALATALAAALALLGNRGRWTPGRTADADGLTASALAVVSSYLVIVAYNFEGVIRYSIPYLTAGISAVIPISLVAAPEGRPKGLRMLHVCVALFLQAAIVVGFAPSLSQRLQQASRSRSMLGFIKPDTDPRYFAYNDFVLRGPEGKRIAVAQGVVPAGETVVAWIANPFHLDYRRNVILDADYAGISFSWPVAGMEARYFIFEHQGFAVKTPAELRRQLDFDGERLLAFRQYLEEKWATADELYNDGELVVFRTRQ